MHRPSRRAATFAFVMLVPVLASLADPGAVETRREARIGIAGVPSSLDPATALDGATPLIARQVFETLLTYRAASTDVEPGLATRWYVSRDGLTWTFAIRDGVRFHDGTPLTAREVRQSLERQMYPRDPHHPSPNPVWPLLLRGLPGVVSALRAPDPRTLQIMLVQPYAPLLTVLAHPGLAIVRPTTGLDGAPWLAGTGPYRLAEVASGRLVLEASAPGAGRVDRLVFVEVATDAEAEAGLDAGTLDVWIPSGPPRRLDGALAVPGTQVGVLVLQTEKEPLARKRVRQAIAAALDPVVVGASIDRAALPLQSFLPPGIWSRREGSPVLLGNRQAARTLLAQGAWPKGFTATLLVGDVPGAVGGPKVAEAIASALGAADLPVQVRVEPADAVRALTQAGGHDLALLEVALDGGDPHHVLYPLSTSEGAQKGPAATNVSFYRNPRLDDLLIRASQLGFRPERERLYTRAQALLADELPWIPIYVRLRWAVARPEVRGLRLHPTGFHRLDGITIDASAAVAPR